MLFSLSSPICLGCRVPRLSKHKWGAFAELFVFPMDVARKTKKEHTVFETVLFPLKKILVLGELLRVPVFQAHRGNFSIQCVCLRVCLLP